MSVGSHNNDGLSHAMKALAAAFAALGAFGLAGPLYHVTLPHAQSFAEANYSASVLPFTGWALAGLCGLGVFSAAFALAAVALKLIMTRAYRMGV